MIFIPLKYLSKVEIGMYFLIQKTNCCNECFYRSGRRLAVLCATALTMWLDWSQTRSTTSECEPRTSMECQSLSSWIHRWQPSSRSQCQTRRASLRSQTGTQAMHTSCGRDHEVTVEPASKDTRLSSGKNIYHLYITDFINTYIHCDQHGKLLKLHLFPWQSSLRHPKQWKC